MALRDKLRDRIQPDLDEGEVVHSIFMGQTGPSPYWMFLSALIILFGAKYRIIAATSKGVRVWTASGFVPSKPKDFHFQSGPQIFQEPGGLWAEVHLGGEKIWVHKRFHKDIEQANAQMRAIG